MPAPVVSVSGLSFFLSEDRFLSTRSSPKGNNKGKTMPRDGRGQTAAASCKARRAFTDSLPSRFTDKQIDPLAGNTRPRTGTHMVGQLGEPSPQRHVGLFFLTSLGSRTGIQ